MGEWAGVEGPVAREVVEQVSRCLATYREDRLRVEQDAAIESNIAQGGYGRKQLYELIQNGADAMLGQPGAIEIVLTRDTLYVANEGRPMTVEGVHALMASHLSRKRGDEIGRFGLGFKSVVAISDSPALYSRSGSFGFDRAMAEKEIETVVPGAPSYPMMRLARVLDADADARKDAVLAELMRWATTVVKVPLKEGRGALAEDLRSFPASFLLFSPHARRVSLSDRVDVLDRVLTVSQEADGVLTLSDTAAEDKDKSVRWRVARREHRPSRAALEDAGDLAHRETISVAWAVPLGGRDHVGRFWAFFPTEERTTLSGIVNAPWKLTDDRRHLLPGAFNEEILTEVLPEVVASEWPHLQRSSDPSWALDLLPARGREERSWADGVLNRPVFDRLREVPSLPDMSGVLRVPSALRIHPSVATRTETDGLTETELATWAMLDPAPSGWVHHSVDNNRERRAKAQRLLTDISSSDSTRIAGVTEWVEALLEPPTLAGSAVAIELVRVLSRKNEFKQQARAAKVVMLEDGMLAPARPGRIFVRSSGDEEGFNFLHPELAALPAAVEALDELGIKLLDRAGELRNAVSGQLPTKIEWRRVWAMSRDCSDETVFSIFREELPQPLELSVRVRNRAGAFVPLAAVFEPGGVIDHVSRGDESFTLDIEYHRDDLEKLKSLGLVSQPTLRSDTPEELWMRTYKDKFKESYIASLTGPKPDPEKLIVEGPPVPWPLDTLRGLSERSRVAMTNVALGLASGQPWKVRHQTAAQYPPKTYMDPTYWWIRQHGRLETRVGAFQPRSCVLADDGDQVPRDVFPVVDLDPSTAGALGVLPDLDSMTFTDWHHLFDVARGWEATRRNLLYAWGAWKTEPPEKLVATVGDRDREVPIDEVAVVGRKEDLRSLQEQRSPVILVEDPDDLAQLIDAWGLEDGKLLLEQELVFEASGEPQVLIDAFPKLRLWDVPASIKLLICESIELVTVTNHGTRTRPVRSYLNEDTLLTTCTEHRDILRSVSEQLQLGMTAEEIQSVLDQIRSQKLEATIARVRSADTVEKKLALLIGEEQLVRQIPAAAVEAVRADLGREPTGEEIARLVLAVHGVRCLPAYKSDLDEKGLEPPTQWVGGSATRRWVADLGFPPEYAGFVEDAKPAMFAVDGPADLDPLHDYQEHVTERIRSMLRGESTDARGLVSLPTGAGKTRVAVQALVEEIAEGRLDGPIVWIAQTNELCDQAVETWSFIWRAKGSARPLHIGRLWGTNEVEEMGTGIGIQLVVATPQKLLSVKRRSEYEWLTDNTVVVVDEAHTSVAPMYTEVLRWLGLGRSRKNRRAMIGLTATPFRNTNVAETRQLAARYDHNRLDAGAFEGDPYEHLQRMDVLAQVEQEILPGVEIELSASELADAEKFKDIPKSALVKLGTNVQRNETILRSVTSLPDDWTVLLFATSVDNARVLASLLTFRGIPAVAISSDTDMAARRHYIDEFRAGRIRVITNYNVLAQGFDAPAVRAVYVTRPTYSANLYQQMIGRGLRGPLNGGSSKVKIVNVQDNVEQYGADLAFTEFEYLWRKDGNGAGRP
ncbi:DEAD/DEAH box helicase family protein [Aeromicrobium senzhongii]|uniref:DEAD/DEAH box helicase family protein n=1 Tax=Aeromicrobium senzhongii TaxID=2663859 RepID=A0ABX6SSI5_9ACTN|nr:DEAD/DEAH box helicase family protein [Aeromicrobium senzhongii]MTB89043.1 DEAD/DEAH box helicase [Aeromicrobium senzhongii]QNL93685.1 DEAD/DEAH box helicase family protein [Aeromicrobium senzhongii]